MNVPTQGGHDARGHTGYDAPVASAGERVREKRLELKLSQEKLAREVGVSKNTVTRWEAGGGIDGGNLDRLALALGVSADWILRGDRREPIAAEEQPDPPFWREFVDRYEHLDALTGEQLEDLKRFAARNFKVRSWTDYERIAEIVRTSQPSPTFESKRGKRG